MCLPLIAENNVYAAGAARQSEILPVLVLTSKCVLEATGEVFKFVLLQPTGLDDQPRPSAERGLTRNLLLFVISSLRLK